MAPPNGKVIADQFKPLTDFSKGLADKADAERLLDDAVASLNLAGQNSVISSIFSQAQEEAAAIKQSQQQLQEEASQAKAEADKLKDKVQKSLESEAKRPTPPSEASQQRLARARGRMLATAAEYEQEAKEKLNSLPAEGVLDAIDRVEHEINNANLSSHKQRQLRARLLRDTLTRGDITDEEKAFLAAYISSGKRPSAGSLGVAHSLAAPFDRTDTIWIEDEQPSSQYTDPSTGATKTFTESDPQGLALDQILTLKSI